MPKYIGGAVSIGEADVADRQRLAKAIISTGKEVGRCQHRDCIYRTTEEKGRKPVHGCNYFFVTGKLRTTQLPEEQRDPSVCPFYKHGRKIKPRPRMPGDRN